MCIRVVRSLDARSRVSKRFRNALAAACVAALPFGFAIPSTDARADDRLPAKVAATYTISFNGFIIGSFRFNSEVKGGQYTLNGDAELSALLGAFKWRGISQASGAVSKQGPKPEDYTLAFNGSARSGSIKIGFDKKGVTSASVVPPFPVASDEVPLERSHLNGALDPLTAVMALTFGSADNPCGQTLAIFDGKQRFNLSLTPRDERVVSYPGGTRRAASVVCGVRYQPLGGYQLNAQTQRLAQSSGIEIAMLPLPRQNIAVPQEITIPTGVGNVVLAADKISVTDRNQKTALLQGY